MTIKTESQKKSFDITDIAWKSILGVLALWGATFLLLLIPNPEQRGQLGDMFGIVNSLFSGLAFAGLILTLFLQRHELSLQREELEQTRREFSEQNKTMKRQRFENTFFNLMTLHQHITNNLRYINDDSADWFEASGREIFSMLYNEKNNFNDTRGLKGYLSNKTIVLLDDLTHYKGIPVLNHYFHSFEGILNYVDNSDLIEQSERFQYAIMLRNTLSDDERCILFYYYAFHGGLHKALAEEYALFYGLDSELLAKPEHIKFFGPSAYAHI